MLRPNRTVLIAVLALGCAVAGAQQNAAIPVPKFAVDPAWPRPLPNGWIVGQVAGVAVDAQDHVWILHRPATLAPGRGRGRGRGAGADTTPAPVKQGIPAPPVIEFDPAGTMVRAWGGRGDGYDWPANEHGLAVDRRGNVWVTGGGARDAHVIEFTPAGRAILQIGKPGVTGGNNDTTGLDRPTGVFVDAAANEVYVTDGEVGGTHRRVVVFDLRSGAYKRHWGAYGEKPADGQLPPYDPAAPVSRQFGTATHCVRIAHDGLVYVCDRSNNRIQVFRKDGTFVKEGFVAKETLGLGAIWDLELSPDQKYIYVGDGQNNKIWILLRDSLQVIGSFAEPGSGPGQLSGVNALAVDSKGNLYAAEAANGSRVQKFAFRGF
jgi:DNA-binding beta-propeller fold protein YncE